jgi:hypothetical protein
MMSCTLFVGSDDYSLHAVDTSSGLTKWSFKTGYVIDWSSPQLSPDGRVVYVGSWDNSTYAIDAASGVMRWKFTTGWPHLVFARSLTNWLDSLYRLSTPTRVRHQRSDWSQALERCDRNRQ